MTSSHRRRNLFDQMSREWGRPERRRRSRRPWIIAVGSGLAFSGLGLALAAAARARTRGASQ
ncbi:hypothetical protein [Asanoa iriomotensis]|uniref:hypothetical protein n=1 Tax=Asanoa iriomotensis TaxID=234613 RepID=UPI0019425D00|nr:hypothetical protein [Asanoa iriomotensis]